MPDREGDNSRGGSALSKEHEFSQHTYMKAVYYSLRSLIQRENVEKLCKQGRHSHLRLVAFVEANSSRSIDLLCIF